MSCKLTLYEHPNYTGDHTHRTTTFTNTDTYGSGSQMSRIQDRDSSGKVEGPCAWAIMEHGHNNGGGFIVDPNEHVPNFHAENHHGEGKGSTNHRFYKRGDRVHRVIKLTPPTNGYWADLDVYFKRADTRLGQWGHFPWVTDSLLENPNDSNQLLTSHTDTGQPCPYGTASIIGHRKYRCTYTSRSSIKNLYDATSSGDPRRTMWGQIADKYCSESGSRLNDAIGSGKSRDRVNSTQLAKEYCQSSNRIKNDSSICTKDELGSVNYNSLLKAWCKKSSNIKNTLCRNLEDADFNQVATNWCKTSTGKADSFCQCYNAVNGVCGNDQKSGPSGCQASGAWVDLRNATPSDFKHAWDGKRQCYGSVCVGAGKFIPPNANQGCDAPIQICAQEFNINSMSNSDITATCEQQANSGSPPSAGSGPSPAERDAQKELEEAEAAVARGDAGAEEELKKAREKLKRLEEEKGVYAYIPKSLEDLKTNRKKQMGALGGVGSFMMIAFCMILLIVIASKGGRRGLRR